MYCETKIAAAGGTPPEAVSAAVAGGNAAHFAEAFAVVGEMHREHGSVSLPPFDQCPKGKSYVAEIDRYALTGAELDRSMAERRNATFLQHSRCVGGTVKINLDNLLSPLRFRIVASPAHKTGRGRREHKDVLSTFAMPSATKVRPSFAVQRGLEPVHSRCLLAPINFESAERRDLAKVDLQPRLLRWF